MARLKGKDDLGDIAGALTAGFNAVTLKDLGERFAASGPDAEKTLTDFFMAAQTLSARENEFNRRSRPDAPDLKANLRGADNFAAIKAFRQARAALLEANPEIGGQIVAVVEKNLASSSRASAKRAFRALQPV